MGERCELTIVLPSYLEEENLRLLLPRLQEALAAEKILFETLVVDTEAPMDETKSVCLMNATRYVNRRGGNLYGDAIRTAIESIDSKFVVFMDADGSHPPEFIPKLLAERHSNDVVIASRYIEGGFTENSYPLILMSRVLNWTYSVVLNLKCKDVSNSFKLYRADLLVGLPLICNNFDIVEEILFKLQRKNSGLRIKEVPFTFKKRMFGETKRNLFLFITTYILTMFKLWASASPLASKIWQRKDKLKKD